MHTDVRCVSAKAANIHTHRHLQSIYVDVCTLQTTAESYKQLVACSVCIIVVHSVYTAGQH